MTIDINKLRRLAQAATPGPWYVTGKLTRYVEARIDGGLIQEVAACGPTKADGGYGPQQEANARLIAAANPAAITELLDRLEAVENENAKLLIALAERVTSETTLRDLIVGNGSINATFEGDAVQLMVDALADRFVESGASNCIEMQFQSKATGPLLFTLQRLDGKTPHQLLAEAEQEKERLLGLAHDQNRELIRLREECRALRAAVQHEADCVEPASSIPSIEVECWMLDVLELIKQYGDERATEAYHGDLHCRKAPRVVFAEIEKALGAAPTPEWK